MRRVLQLGLCLVAAVAFSGSPSVPGTLMPAASALSLHQGLPPPLPFRVTEATCARFTLEARQQHGAATLHIDLNGQRVHEQVGLHFGPPLQKAWPAAYLVDGQNAFTVTAHVLSRTHVFDGSFTCPVGTSPGSDSSRPVMPDPTDTDQPEFSTPTTPPIVTPLSTRGVASTSVAPTLDATLGTASPSATIDPIDLTLTPTGTATPTATATASVTLTVVASGSVFNPTASPTSISRVGTPAPGGKGAEPTPGEPSGHLAPPGSPPPDGGSQMTPQPVPIPTAYVCDCTPEAPALPRPPDTGVPQVVVRFVEMALDVVQGGRGYTQAERAELVERRQEVVLSLNAPSLPDGTRIELEEERAQIDKNLAPFWDSPWRNRTFEEVHAGLQWRWRMLQIATALIIGMLLLARVRSAVKAAVEDAEEAAATGSLASVDGAMPVLKGVSGETFRLSRGLQEIIIPDELKARVKATIVGRGNRRHPGICIDGREDRTYPLSTPIRRVYFSELAKRNGRPVRHSAIKHLLPREYGDGKSVWAEGKPPRPQQIVVDGVVSQDAETAMWSLNLDA